MISVWKNFPAAVFFFRFGLIESKRLPFGDMHHFVRCWETKCTYLFSDFDVRSHWLEDDDDNKDGPCDWDIDFHRRSNSSTCVINHGTFPPLRYDLMYNEFSFALLPGLGSVL